MKISKLIIIALLIILVIIISFLWGVEHQELVYTKRLETIRKKLVNVPDIGTRPRNTVIKELGIRIYFIGENGPVRNVLLEDLR